MDPEDYWNPLCVSEDECEDIEKSVLNQPTLRTAILAAAAWLAVREKPKVSNFSFGISSPCFTSKRLLYLTRASVGAQATSCGRSTSTP